MLTQRFVGQRITKPSDATLKYNGKRDQNIISSVTGTFIGTSNEIYEIGVFINGNLQTSSIAEVEGGGSNKPKAFVARALEPISQSDDTSIRVRNTSGTGDATFSNYSFTVESQ